MRNDNRIPRRYGTGATAAAAEAEFAGRVDYVGPEPEFLSGLVPALQTIGLSVTDVRRGDLAVGDNLEVDVLIVAGNPHIGIGATELPALDAAQVQPGVLLVAFANRANERWRALEVSTDGPSSGGANV